MLRPDLGGDTVANQAVLNGRKRVADALVRNAMSRAGFPATRELGPLDRQATVRALKRMKSAAAPAAPDRRLAYYDGFMDPDMAPWALDRGFAGPVTPRYRDLDQMLDQTYDDLLNDDHLGVLRDHRSTRFGSRNGQADEAMGPLDLLGGVSSLFKSRLRAFRAPVGATETNLSFENAPDYLANPRGVVLPVPRGAYPMPTPVKNEAQKQTGTAFSGGTIKSSSGVDNPVDLRMMNPTEPRGRSPGYPRGYSAYSAVQPPPGGRQTVDPYTGRTLRRDHPWAHIPN